MSVYEYKGYKYEPENDVEYGDEGPENVKIYHFVVTPEGKTVSFDWSPYSTPSEDDFRVWIELGLPERIAEGKIATFPLDHEDLNTLAKQWFNKHFGRR